jgi:serine/threonine protein kinase
VIHRDVKPDNIVLGQGDRVRLLDFGACLLMPRFYQRHLMYPATPTAQRYATGELETVGTPGYTAPEVLEMRGGVGPRSDIYSVCVVLYEMLTGRRYESPATGRAPPIDRGEFPAALGPIADVLRRGTAREPSERPWSMADLVRSPRDHPRRAAPRAAPAVARARGGGSRRGDDRHPRPRTSPCRRRAHGGRAPRRVAARRFGCRRPDTAARRTTS